MADSIREKIRDNVVSTLQSITAANGYANTCIVESRLQWGNPEKDRRIVVDVSGQEPTSDSPIGCQRWFLNMDVIAYAVESETSTTPIFDRLNSLACDIERAILVDPQRGNLADDTYIRGIDFEIAADGTVAAVDVRLAVQYWQDYTDPTSQI